MALLFSNNANTTLAGSITNTATSLNVAAGTGALFPNPTGGDTFTITLTSAADSSIQEIMSCTARSTDTLTVARAQEGTTALNWTAGDSVSQLWTAGQAAALEASAGPNQQQAANYSAADTGTANQLILALTPAPASLAALVGAPIRFIKIATANTGNVTAVVNGLAATPVLHGDGTQVEPGELGISCFGEIMYNGTDFIVMALSHAPASAGDMEAGTEPTRQVTPANEVYGMPAIKAWAIFHWSGSAVIVTDSYNVASVARSGVGAYLVTLSGGLNFTHGFAMACGNGASPAIAGSIGIGVSFTGTNPAFTVHFGDSGGSGGEASDPLIDVGVLVFGRTAN